MKKIHSARKFARHLLIAGLAILTSFSVAEAQHRGGGGGGHSFGGGGHSFAGGGRGFSGGARISSGARGNIGGGNHFSGNVRGSFGGGNRIAAVPRSAPGRFYGGVRGSINIGAHYGYRGGYYGRSYYGRPYFGAAYYHSYFPHIGFYLNTLPYGYYPFSYGGYPYYYNEGLFYQQYNDGYQVVAPPMGAEVPNLPRGAQEIAINGNQYFEKDGIYYEPIVDENGRKIYRVTGKDGVLNTDGDQEQYDQPDDDNNTANNSAPYYNNAMPRVGDVVNTIPANSRRMKINGQYLFVSPDGIYYQEDNSGQNRLYKVVGIPTDDGADSGY